jgi:hypothetical protein
MWVGVYIRILCFSCHPFPVLSLPDSDDRVTEEAKKAAAAAAALEAKLTPWVVAIAKHEETTGNHDLSQLIARQLLQALQQGNGPISRPVLALLRDQVVPPTFITSFKQAQKEFAAALEAADEVAPSAPAISVTPMKLTSLKVCESLSVSQLKTHIVELRRKKGDQNKSVKGKQAELAAQLWELAKPPEVKENPGCDDSCNRDHSGHGNCLVCSRGWGPHNGHRCQAPFEGRRGSWRDPSQAPRQPPPVTILVAPPKVSKIQLPADVPLLNPAHLCAKLMAKSIAQQVSKSNNQQGQAAIRQLLLQLLQMPPAFASKPMVCP